MNFLSHFYIHQQGPNPLYSTGLVLPDLARGFVKHPGKLENTNYAHLLDLALGCRQHYLADKVFHGSEFFTWGTHQCTEVVKQAKFETQVERRWFIGHILFELLLDRILVRHQPQVAIDFYENLRLLQANELNEFISLHEHKEKDRFLKFFEHFRKAAYIHNYPDNNLFAFSLSRIIIRAGLPELSHADKIVLQECVWQLEANQFKNAQGILIELKEVFK
ncbi:MAG: hypothetical protein CFE21_13745 [Bacteroidetes bacterium B1(2017)]|nr:MAG: hypothetical protein CFE21_13745 [Bacteroidetes bacterium B1(2017)]